jgi:hypothetical protein
VAVDAVVQEVSLKLRVAKDLSDTMPVLVAPSLMSVFLSFLCGDKSLLGDVDSLLGDLADLFAVVSSDSGDGVDIRGGVTTSTCF